MLFDLKRVLRLQSHQGGIDLPPLGVGYITSAFGDPMHFMYIGLDRTSLFNKLVCGQSLMY